MTVSVRRSRSGGLLVLTPLGDLSGELARQVAADLRAASDCAVAVVDLVHVTTTSDGDEGVDALVAATAGRTAAGLEVCVVNVPASLTALLRAAGATIVDTREPWVRPVPSPQWSWPPMPRQT